MKLKYDLNIDDLTAYTLYYHTHTPKIKRKRRVHKVLWIFITIIFLLLAVIGYSGYNFALAVISSLGFLFSIFMFYYYLTWPMIRRRVRKELLKTYLPGKNSVTGNHEITITPELIKSVGEMGEDIIRWDVIDNVVATEQHLFLTFHISTQAYIIPRRAFENDTGFDKFAETARTYHQAATESKV